MNKYLFSFCLMIFSGVSAMEDRQIVRSSEVIKPNEIMNDVEFIIGILNVIQDKVQKSPQDILLGCGTINGINNAQKKAEKVLKFLKNIVSNVSPGDQEGHNRQHGDCGP